MPEHHLSRRAFLAAAGLGAATLMAACEGALTEHPPVSPGPPSASPALPGPYAVNRLILGEDAGTTALDNPYTLQNIPKDDFDTVFNRFCQDGHLAELLELPKRVLAAVYYPYKPNVRDHRIPTPNPLGLSKGPYPLLLYAHGYRSQNFSCSVVTPLNRDFTTVGTMLSHVASYGCVCVAPDLSYLPGGFDPHEAQQKDVFQQRGVVLIDYYNYLMQVFNKTLFARQLDPSRIVLVGHSTGAGGATAAGNAMAALGRSLSYALIAPIPDAVATSEIRPLLVLRGGRDTRQGADPLEAFAGGGMPKTLVTIPGANHFGYTDLCDANNHYELGDLYDPNGAISRAEQQRAGAAYLAAFVRYHALGDGTMRPYLSGEKVVEEVGDLNLQVQSQGFSTPLGTFTPVLKP
jgi:predicted dienelactone hydrolase